MRIVIGAGVVVVAAVLTQSAALAAPVPAADRLVASAAPASVTLEGQIASSQTVAYGAAGGIGDLTAVHGTVSDEAGRVVGQMTGVMRVVTAATKSRPQMRDTQIQVRLAGGQIFAQAVLAYSPAGQIRGTARLSVTGGTGSFATAHGSLQVSQSGRSLSLDYDVSSSKGMKSESVRLDSVMSTRAKGDAKDGVGNVVLARATGSSASYVSVATRLGSSDGRVSKSTDLQVFMDDGSIFSRSVSRHRSGHAGAQAFAVLGGTGAYKGVRGELILGKDGRSLDLRLLKSSGKATVAEWWENNGDGVEGIPIAGGTTMGLYGDMYGSPDRAKKIGGFYVTRMQYAEVGGVTPVVTMLEQDFGSGKMLISGITLATGAGGSAVVRPIIGGTGDYLDADGQVSSSQEGADLWKKHGRFWR